jgi:hypothetical protein
LINNIIACLILFNQSGFVLDEAFIVANADGSRYARSADIECLAGDTIYLFPVLKCQIDGKIRYYSTLDSARINGKMVNTQQMEKWEINKMHGIATIEWYDISATNLWYVNELQKGEMMDVNYCETLISSDTTWHKRIIAHTGTERYKVAIECDSQVISSGGIEKRNKNGSLPGVFRISARENLAAGDNVDYMTFFFNLPFIYGNSREQADNWVGIDCQDLIWFGLYRSGIVPTADYDNHIHYTHTEKKRFDGFLINGVTCDTLCEPVTLPIERGDIVRLVEFGHYGTIYKDSSPDDTLNGNGVLDGSDLVIHILFSSPGIEMLSDITEKHNDRHIQIYRFDK